MTFLAYLPVLSAGFIWDDDTHVTNQPLLATWDGLRAIWLQPGATPQYYPLTHSTFWLEYHLFALQPLGYHVVNVVLHTVNASLVCSCSSGWPFPEHGWPLPCSPSTPWKSRRPPGSRS